MTCTEKLKNNKLSLVNFENNPSEANEEEDSGEAY